MSPPSVATTLNKDMPLHVDPHYTDSRFKTEQTIFGIPSKSPHGHKELSYAYSDRLWQWDYEKAKQSAEKANQTTTITPKSARWFENYLSTYFDKPVEVIHIIAGVNRSNGYSYLVFGYKEV